MGELYSNMDLNVLQDYLVFLAATFVLLFAFIFYLLIKNYLTTKHVEAQLRRFHLSDGEADGLTRKLYSAESTLAKYGLGDPKLRPLEKLLDAYAVTVTDKKGTITYANDSFCQLSGYSRDELIGQSHRIVGSNLHPEAFWADLWNTVSANKVWHGEVANRHKNGELYWLDTIIMPLSLITETDSGYLSLRTDITAIKQANQQLAREIEQKEQTIHSVQGVLYESEKMASLGLLAAGVAHEVNNPMSYISSNTLKLQEYLEALSPVARAATAGIQNDLPPETLKENLRRAIQDHDDIQFILDDTQALVNETLDGIQRVRKIVADLKSFTHNGGDQAVPADLHKSIESALNLANNEIKYKARVIREFGDIPPVTCIEPKINQVLLNLLVNAAQAIDGHGEIRIRTGVNDKNEVEVAVSDTGAGISDEHLERIFDPTFTTKPVGQGTGIGLAISQDIIARHNGRMTVDSEVGRGTTFTLFLPVTPRESEQTLDRVANA